LTGDFFELELNHMDDKNLFEQIMNALNSETMKRVGNAAGNAIPNAARNIAPLISNAASNLGNANVAADKMMSGEIKPTFQQTTPGLIMQALQDLQNRLRANNGSLTKQPAPQTFNRQVPPPYANPSPMLPIQSFIQGGGSQF
jgi:hypothetical protein